MAERSPNRKKTLWEKEKLLVTSNFSFSHSVFKRLVPQTRENQGLFGKGILSVWTSLKTCPSTNDKGRELDVTEDTLGDNTEPFFLPQATTDLFRGECAAARSACTYL